MAAPRRALFVLLLVCLTLVGQSFALASQDETHHAPDHCCLLCHAGPLPFLQTTVAGTVTPVVLVAWLAPSPDFGQFHQVPLAASSSRGPPAQSPFPESPCAGRYRFAPPDYVFKPE